MKNKKVVVLLACVAVVTVLSAAGCARKVALKEFKPTLTSEDTTVKDKRFYVDVRYSPNAGKSAQWISKQPIELKDFRFRPMDNEDTTRWEAEVKNLKKAFVKRPEALIGRSSLAKSWLSKKIEQTYVYVLNDPAVWLKECIRMEIKQSGGRIVETPDEADCVIQADIFCLSIVPKLKVFALLMVDLSIKPKRNTERSVTVFTRGEVAAISNSAFECYKSIRESEQKFIKALFAELSVAVQSSL